MQMKIFFITLFFAGNVFAGTDDFGYPFLAKCIGRGVGTSASTIDYINGCLVTLSNSPSFDGEAYTLNGSTQIGCYQNASIGNFQTSDFFTVVNVFKTTNNASFKGLSGKYHLTPDQGWFTALNKVGTNVLFYFQIQTSATQYLAKTGNQNLNDGRYHTCIAHYDGNATSNSVMLYVDGLRQVETVDRAGTVTSITSVNPIVFGSREPKTASERCSGTFKANELISGPFSAGDAMRRTVELNIGVIHP